MRAKKLPVFLWGEEPELLLAACRCRRDRVICLLGYKAGLRVEEIAELTRPAIRWADKNLFIDGKGSRQRYVPMGPALANELADWVDLGLPRQRELFEGMGGDSRQQTADGRNRPLWLFPSPRLPTRHLTTRAIYNMVVATARRAGIVRPGAARISPHKLRHTCATNMLTTGAHLAEVRDLLGHESIATTQIYVHCVPDRLREAVERMG